MVGLKLNNVSKRGHWWKVELDYPIWVTHVEVTNRNTLVWISTHWDP